MAMVTRGLSGTADVQALIRQTAQQYGVPEALALAVAKQESGYNQAARGAAGEIGVFQLMPGTAAGLHVNPYDLTQNVQGGVSYLARMLAKYGDPGTALAAYNAGPGNVDRGRIPTSTQSYVASVLSMANLVPGDLTLTGPVSAGILPLTTPPAPQPEDYPYTPDLGPIPDSGGLDLGTIGVVAAAGALAWALLH